MNTPQRASRPERYPISCQHCGIVAAVPVAVTTVAGQPRSVRLEFKCGACDHRWSEQFDDQFVIAVPSTDPSAAAL
jgi:hypothetical protein